MLDNEIKKYLKQEVILKKTNSIYLETGFFKGDSALQALELGFSKVISIEIDKYLVEEGKRKFSNFIDTGRLILVNGDSSEKISEYYDSSVNVLFLDAHGQSYFDNINKIVSAPLEKELEFLQKNITGDQIILIDDYIKIKNSFYFSKDSWKSKFMGKKLKRILNKFDQQMIELPYTSKTNSLTANSYLIIYNEKYTKKINIEKFLLKKINNNYKFFKLYGLNMLKNKIIILFKHIFGENIYKKIKNFF